MNDAGAQPLVVFVGPTLAAPDVLAILPEALVLPPVRCGDVLQALRLEPRAIVIIDGTFERSAAVWHKEILVALERGVPVIGAASMGALRAAELSRFGMVGVGQIYRRYASGEYLDDDEVAVIHSEHGTASSEAMVNIRATVARAEAERQLAPRTARALLRAAKRLFFHERTLEAALDHLDQSAEIVRFRRWIEQGGAVDQKRRDAEEALQRARALAATAIEKLPEVPRSNFLRLLQREVACSAFRRHHALLPRGEQVVLAARFLGDSYVHARTIAGLLASLHAIAIARGERRGERASRLQGGLCTEVMTTRGWAQQCDLSPQAHSAFLRRCRAVAQLEADVQDGRDAAFQVQHRAGRYLRFHLVGEGLYARRNDLDRRRLEVLRLAARLLRLVDILATEAGMNMSPHKLLEEIDRFRERRGLSAERMARWLEDNELSARELCELVHARYRIRCIAGYGQLEAFGARIDETVHWLKDALLLTDLYGQARQLMGRPAAELVALVERPATLAAALDRNFDDEHEAFARELAALSAPSATARPLAGLPSVACRDGGVPGRR